MTNPNPPNTLDESNNELKQALTAALLSLADMYDQYCGDNYGHAFMGAGEGAIEILENYGLADEVHGVDWEAYEAFEAKHKVTDKQPSQTKPDISEDVDIAVGNLIFAGLSIDRINKLPKWLLENIENNKPIIQTLITNKQLEELNFILKNASGGGSWRRVIIGRIAQLTKKVSKDE